MANDLLKKLLDNEMQPLDFNNEPEDIAATDVRNEPVKLDPGLPYAFKSQPLELPKEEKKAPSLEEVLANLKKPQDDSDLVDAQRSRNDMLSKLLYMKAANTATQGILGQKADPNFLADHVALNENKVKDVRELKKSKMDQEELGMKRSKNYLDEKKNILDFEDDSKRRDPNSAESKEAVRMLNTLALENGMKPLYKEGDISFARIRELQPIMGQAIEARARRDAAALSRENMNTQRQLAREERSYQREVSRDDKLKKESLLSDKQVADLTTIDNSLDTLSSIEALKSEMDTGKISAAQNTLAQVVGIDDPQKSAFKSLVQDQLAQYIKSISGAAVSDVERKFLLENLPNVSDNDKTFNAKLKAVKDRLNQSRNRTLSNLSKKGKNVQEFSRETDMPEEFNKKESSTKANKFPMQVRKGNQIATISDEEELKEANSEGWN